MSSTLPNLACSSGACSLEPGTVEVVSIDLDVSRPVLEMREKSLSPDEREHTSRFRFERDRRRFVACRGAVRALIGSLTGSHPSAICFEYGPSGKPELDGALAGALAFNVSHSEDVAFCAVAPNGPIGVDGERLRDLPDLDSIAAHFFSPLERAFIRDAAVVVRVNRFFYLWTLKEAWLKAKGEGLSGPLTEFEIVPGPDGNPNLRASRCGVPSDQWRLRSFYPVPGWIGAIATRDEARIVLRTWSD
jgi:4'-phosphopantetheinyl transferase